MLNKVVQTTNTCPCGSEKVLSRCCLPYLENTKNNIDPLADMHIPQTAESLMRSRFTAYYMKDYNYIVHTYASEEAGKLSAQMIQQSDEGVEWLRLTIVKSTLDTVEFKAWYRNENAFYLMHETSSFVQENEQWRYISGAIHKDSGRVKMGRNDICLCGSGKKYKRCCASN